MLLAAKAAWRTIRAEALTRVIPGNTLLASARGPAQAAARGIRLRLSVGHQGTHMWGLVVTGQRGAKRATVRKGRAWFGRDPGHREWLSAAPDQTARHRAVEARWDRELDTIATGITRTSGAPRYVADQMAPRIRQKEASDTAGVLTGVRINVDEAQASTTSDNAHLRYRIQVHPNTHNGHITVPIKPAGWTRTGTYALTHPALAQASPPITQLGPWKLQPGNPWSARPTTPRFKLEAAGNPAAAWTSPQRWDATYDTPTFAPEHYSWDSTQYKLVQNATAEAGMVRQRKNWMTRHVIDLSAARTVAAVAKRMSSWGVRNSPRTFNSVDAEESLDQRQADRARASGTSPVNARPPAALHPHSRHVLQGGDGLRSTRDLDWRAAIERVVEDGAYVNAALDGTRAASAFRSNAAALQSLRYLARHTFAPAWATAGGYRDRLATTGASNELVTGPIPPVRVEVSTRGATTNKASAAADRPAHAAFPDPRVTAPTHPFNVASAGNRPLSNRRETLREWRRWWLSDTTRGPAPIPNPIVTGQQVLATRAAMRIAPDWARPNAYGIALITLYPVI